jgi:hypothetical protein
MKTARTKAKPHADAVLLFGPDDLPVAGRERDARMAVIDLRSCGRSSSAPAELPENTRQALTDRRSSGACASTASR